MEIKAFFDKRTFTLTYVVYDPKTRDAVVIDPVLDYEPGASKTFTESVEKVIEFIKGQGLKLHYVMETHAHADHLSGSQLFKDACPDVKVAIGARITDVQKKFKEIFDLPEGFATDGRQFDRLLDDGEVLEAGSLKIGTIYTPGHTPACAAYHVGDAIFTGDALFMPDQGTGRCDFPGGSADDLYTSVAERLYKLPDETRVFVGHDYQPGDRDVAYESTIGAQKRGNVALPASRSREDFVSWRRTRDSSLAAPKLLYQSVQVNVDGGRLPEPGPNKIRYLKIPINAFRPEEPGNMEYLKLDCHG
jgi:glyoxylase-like metal-dependent hydrolase (beta-lactamase superfamily II)